MEVAKENNTTFREIHNTLSPRLKNLGKDSTLTYSGSLVVENRNGLIVDAEGLQANGRRNRDSALVMMERLGGTQPLTVGRRQRLRRGRICGGVPKSARNPVAQNLDDAGQRD
jgi:hypothetical protein